MFEKLEKENSTQAPLRAGLTFGNNKWTSNKTGLGNDTKASAANKWGTNNKPTSYSASAAQVNKTRELINSFGHDDTKAEKAESMANLNTNFDNRDKVTSRSRLSDSPSRDKKGEGSTDSTSMDNQSVPTSTISSNIPSKYRSREEKPEAKVNGVNGFDSKSSYDSESHVEEPKSEPVLPSERLLTRQLSSDLPQPYQPDKKSEIRSVRRPFASASSTDSSRDGEKKLTDRTESRRSAGTSLAQPSEKRLSKDDIAASLAAAESYLKKINSSESSTPPRSPDAADSSANYENFSATSIPSSQQDPPSRPRASSELSSTKPEGSASYDNVPDVLADLQADNDNVQRRSHVYDPANVVKPWERDSILETNVDEGAAVAKLKHQNHVVEEEEHMAEYDSVYLQSKPDVADHTYNNIHSGIKRPSTNDTQSDDEPYETVAPPTPPVKKRTGPSSLPLAQDPEVMSQEEAQNFLSFK